MDMTKTQEVNTNYTGKDIVQSGDGMGVPMFELTTKSLQDIDVESTESNGVGIAPTSGFTANAGFVIGVVLLLLFVIILTLFLYRKRKYMKKRRNNPYHVPIIEYKEDNVSVSTFHSVGYGTYRDLEEYPITDDMPDRIGGKLTLFSNEVTT